MAQVSLLRRRTPKVARADLAPVLCVHAHGRSMRRLPLRPVLFASVAFLWALVLVGFGVGYLLREALTDMAALDVLRTMVG